MISVLQVFLRFTFGFQMIVIQMYDLRPLVVSMPSLELYQGTQVLLNIELLDSVQNSKGRYNNIPLFKINKSV